MPRGSSIAPEERARRDRIIRAGVASGDTVADIAKAAGCRDSYVAARLHKLGLHAERRQKRARRIGRPLPRRAAP